MEAQHVFAHYDRGDAGPAGRFTLCPSCGAQLEIVESGGVARPSCPRCGFVQYRNPAPAVSILILDGASVVLGRRKNEPGKGTWALPSGYVEWDDDFLTTAVQEAKEETGLDVVPCTIVNVLSSFISPRFHFLGIYLSARVAGGELQAGDDLDAVAWYPVQGPLPQMGFAEDAHAIALVAAGAPGLRVHQKDCYRVP